MNKRNLILLSLGLVMLAQLAVPAWLIVEREWTLREGQIFKFKTQPVDPADPFRGRYVWLRLEPDTIAVPDAQSWLSDKKAFAVLGQDTNGFALVKRLERTPPLHETAVQVRTRWPDIQQGTVHIAWLGLDRYYMTEAKAPAAENAYLEHNRRAHQSCYVTVRVRATHAALENLFIDNQPIQDWLREHSPSR